MKLGILQVAAPTPLAIDGSLAVLGLRALLDGHTLTHAWVSEEEEHWADTVRGLDAWILIGSEAPRVRELSAKLNIPLVSIPAEGAVVFAKFRSLHHKAPRTVFCPPPSEAEKGVREAGLGLYQRLSAKAPTLWLADGAQDLENGAVPGSSSFFCPFFPALAGRALASAQQVVSYRPLPALAAAAQGVASALAGTNGPAGWPKLDPEQTIFANYPWKTVKETIARLEAQTLASLKKAGIPVAEGRTEPRATAGQKLHVASISDSNYLPFLMGFIENVLTFESAANTTFYVAALDDGVGPTLRQHYPDLNLVVWELKDLWAPSELGPILERGVGFRAFSSKPRFLERAVAHAKAPVVYCDSDVYFFRSPHTLREALGPHLVLLFPHWNDVFLAARRDGLFNAGMVVAGPGSEIFLEWWTSLCLETCTFAHDSGLVGDQGYLDFAPVYFDGVHVYREGDQDVARWNLKSLSVKFPKTPLGEPLAGKGQPIGSYHAAFVDSLGLFEAKYAWDQVTAFFSQLPSPDAVAPLFRNTIDQQRVHWLTLSRANVFAAKFGKDLTPSRAKRLTRGVGKRWVTLLAAVNQKLQRRPPPGGPDPNRFWIAALRSLIDPHPGVG